MTWKDALLIILSVITIWFSTVIIRLENERYAMSLGMCQYDNMPVVTYNSDCLKSVETRTSFAWHLAQALFSFP